MTDGPSGQCYTDTRDRFLLPPSFFPGRIKGFSTKAVDQPDSLGSYLLLGREPFVICPPESMFRWQCRQLLVLQQGGIRNTVSDVTDLWRNWRGRSLEGMIVTVTYCLA